MGEGCAAGVSEGARVNAPDRMTQFLARVRQQGAQRYVRADYRLYEQLKHEFVREFPAALPSEYDQAMRAIAEAAGV